MKTLIGTEVAPDLPQVVLRTPQLRTEMAEHADITGSNVYNMDQSQKRAEAVRDYLVSQGIPEAHASLE